VAEPAGNPFRAARIQPDDLPVWKGAGVYFEEPVDGAAPPPVSDDLPLTWSPRVTKPQPGPGLAARLQAALGSQYELGPEIGRGGMGVVFLARDVTLARDVAVKAVHPELAIHSSIAQRFLAEARMIARLRHPNIVTVYTAGEADDILYFVMDRVPGESLRERLNRDGKLPPEEARRITMDIAAAIDAAAGAGLVHRDVKPENILLEAGSGRALLADFGIARALAAEPAGPSTTAVTGQGMVVGTPNYMSPEQAAGEEVDSRSDLYSLGVVAYEMLAGHPPFVGPNRVVVSKHISEQPITLTRVRPECPADLNAGIMRALAKAPGDRFQSGAEFRSALGGTPTPVPGFARTRKRRFVLVGAAVALLTVVAALVVRRPGGVPDGVNPRLSMLVLPFDNLRDDQSTDWLRNGSVNMLALNLSQWKDMTVVDHERVHDLLARYGLTASDDIGLDMARKLARDAGVWTVVLGDYQQVGDSLHLTARVFDVATGTRTDVAEVSAPASDDPRPGFDQLALRLLDISGAPGETWTDLASVTSPSIEAYRSYLSGLDRLNRWELAAAQRNFERAVDIDTTFGLAYYKLALTRGWMVGAQDSAGHQAIDRAVLYSQKLPAHDRAVITAYRFFLLGENTASRNIYQQLLARDPRDADAWYGLGDSWFHDDAVPRDLGYTESLRAFRRTLALAPDYTLAYEHVQAMLDMATRPATGMFLVTPDSFAMGPRVDSVTRVAATNRARQAVVESARAWSAAQPATGRAHLAMVDALLASQQYADALAEVARFRAADPSNPEMPFLQARVRFASGEGPRAAAELKSAMATITAGDFAGAEDAPTVMADVMSGANIFAYYGDLASAARVIELVDEIRTDVLAASIGENMKGWDWKRSMQASLYGAAGVPVAALERIWATTAEEARSVPADGREPILYSGKDAALGLFTGPAADARPLEEFSAIGGKPLPGPVTALLALDRQDTTAARKALAAPDSGRKLFANLRPLYAQAQFLLGDYAGTVETLRLFETDQFLTRGFDSRWAQIGRVRLLRGAAYEKLGRRTEAAEQYQLVLSQWKSADPELEVFLRQAEAGLARVQGRG
jgi:tetratricopeptide (TPR) repeat protein/TolB-like protein